jgi:pheromone shutdown protein TraB
MATSKYLILFLTCLLLSVTSAASGAFAAPALKQQKQPETTSTSIGNNTTTSAVIPEWKKELPYPLNNKTKTLQRIIVSGPSGRTVEIYLLGTAHVSIDSSREVDLLLQSINPDVIFLELCDQRISMLVTPPLETKQEDSSRSQEEESIKKRWWNRRKRPKKQSSEDGQKSLHGMASNMLTNMQQDYADSLGVELGGEFRAAYNYWEKKRVDSEVHMILGDRPLYLTLTRAWESLKIWGKAKLLIGLFISTLQKPNPDELREWMESILADDSGDILTKSIEELKKHFPTLEEVIIRERDAYMACKLYQVCRQLLVANHQSPKQRLVAIVGAGHVQGMCHWLTVGNGKSPEHVLEELIQIKNAIPKEDAQILTHDIMAVNHDLLQQLVQEIQ